MLDSGSTCRSAACSHCLEDNMQNQAKKKSKPNPSSQSTRTTRKTQVGLKPCPCGQDRLHIYSKPAAKRWLETMGSSDVQLKELEKIPVKDLVHMIKSDEKNDTIYGVPYECVLCDRKLPGLEEIIRKEEERDKEYKGRTFDQLVARAHDTWREDARKEKNQERKKRSGV